MSTSAMSVVGPRGTHAHVARRGHASIDRALAFVDASYDVLYAYAAHRTGSHAAAGAIIDAVLMETCSRSMAFWWFGTLNIASALRAVDQMIASRASERSDVAEEYAKSIPWFTTAEDKASIAALHDALWTQPTVAQRLIVLSLLVGLSPAAIAKDLRMQPATVEAQLAKAIESFVATWQPAPAVRSKLDSLVFLPTSGADRVAALRQALTQKYSSLKFRSYQWAIVGGIFAVLSNVIVASVLAFAVVTQPPATLRGVRMQVASLDAVLIERDMRAEQVRQSVDRQLREVRRLAATDATRKLTDVGLGIARDALQQEQRQEKVITDLQALMRRAATAMAPIMRTIAQVLRWVQ